MNSPSGLVLVTQYAFFMTFSGFAASVVYFFMERNNLTPRYSVVASLSAMIVGIAALNYLSMVDFVGRDGMYESIANFPTAFRYVDWILTTPLILAVLALLTSDEHRIAIAVKLGVADALMVLSGYLGEVSINEAGGGTAAGWVWFLVSCVAFGYILYVVYGQLAQAAGTVPEELRGAFNGLRNFVIISWLIYPLGYLVPLLGFGGPLLVIRELLYCIADLAAKTGFGMVAVSLAKRLSLLEVEKSRS